MGGFGTWDEKNSSCLGSIIRATPRDYVYGFVNVNLTNIRKKCIQ
jgi:hypothetical protein